MAQQKIDLPISTGQTWDEALIRATQDRHVMGNFRDITALSRSLMTDSRFKIALDKRVLGLLQAPVLITPASADEDPDELAAASLIEDHISVILPHQMLIRLMTWFHNVSLCPATYDWVKVISRASPQGFIWLPSLRTLNPQNTYWDSSQRVFKHILANDGVETITPGVDGWLLMTTWDQGTPSGFASSLGMSWVQKQMAIAAQLDWLDNHASPLLCAITPLDEAATAAEREKFISDIYYAKHTKVIECRQSTPGVGWNVVPVPVPATGFDAYQQCIDSKNADIIIGVLGANLTTEVGATGTRSAAETHLAIQRELTKADDCALGEFARSLFSIAIDSNFAKHVEPPYYTHLIRGDDETTQVTNVADENSKKNDSAPTGDLAPESNTQL